MFLNFFYKQPVCKQLALGQQVAKQLSGLNLFSQSNNKLVLSFVINEK